ncbi:hypothetical protein HCN44_001704 [Aphidius gifuensis]|uniref:alpha-1,2-Mannosidase n=1 Tax=Aphidius gifuensis TaxID=684658 RepID=A0A834XWF8_APHGI|nr:hypothetical protein HCN44_001704 [Aphidius gifuensis]
MTTTSLLLPSYNRFVNGVPVPLFSRRSFRPREKYLILLVFLTFGVVCFGAFFFLPDFRTSGVAYNSVYRVYQKIQKVGPDLLIPAPPHGLSGYKDPHGPGGVYPNVEHVGLERPDDARDIDIHIIEDKIKLQMMKHAWSNYVTYAWGENELKPISKRGHSASVFGATKMGATIVDALDTLYVMGMQEEFKQGRDWIDKNLNFTVDSEMSLFEINIRFLGSLLTSFALTGDKMFREKALQIGERMLPAFETKTGIPHSLINLYTGRSRNHGWASSGCSILSEIGTMHLEFSYLSDITGNPIFRKKVEQVRRVLKDLDKPKGLYPNFIHPETGKWGQHHISLGGLGDSFYEYLLKAWIQSGKEDTEAKKMYDEAIAAVVEHMIMTSKGGLTYLSDLRYDRPDHKMGHLACFAGGMFALGAQVNENEVSNQYMDIGAELTNTCHESYIRSATKLGPEAFHFIEGNEARSLKNDEKYYILRPETYESYFILWRLTKDQKYRDWGWEAVEALEMHCRVPHGFSGLRDVYKSDSIKDDVQQSYFFAESLKYLYLLFSDDNLISLDDWVFNSEAHMLPIKGSNPLYRQAQLS